MVFRNVRIILSSGAGFDPTIDWKFYFIARGVIFGTSEE